MRGPRFSEASSTRSARAQTEVPCVMLKECAKPSLSAFTTMLMSPCRQRVTAFERWMPGLLETRARSSVFSNPTALRSSTANSTNSMPEQTALGGRAGRSARAAPVRRRSSSSMTISERCPSMATLRAEPARKRSLKISSESRPSKPGRVQREHEIVDRQVALPGKAAIMPAPGQVIHVELRRVGHLHEEDPLRRNRADRRQVRLRAQAHGRNRAPVRPPDDRPAARPPRNRGNRGCAAPRTAPRKPTRMPRFAARSPSSWKSAAARSMPPSESGETLLQTIRRSQPSSSITSNLRSARANTLDRCGSGMPSKSRNGWKVIVSRPEILDHAPRFGRRTVERQKIVFEDLDALELRGRDGFDLLGQSAAQADGGDGFAHARRFRFLCDEEACCRSGLLLVG